MNQRSKVTAAVLAILLGVFGTHWFYLGNQKAGKTYLGLLGVGFLLLPFGIGLWLLLLLPLLPLFDFFSLLAMDPSEFNRLYN